VPYSTADPNAFLALGMQSALGTPQVTAAKLRYVPYLAGNNFQPQMEIVDLREGGDGLDIGAVYKRTHFVSGQIVANLRPEIAGVLLGLAVGGATWNGGSAPATHLFHTGHASFPWASILAQHPGSSIAHLVSDVKITGFTLALQSGEPWRLTLPFTAIGHGASIAAVTPTYYKEGLFLYHESPTYVLDGSADSDITAITITGNYGNEVLYTQAVSPDEIPILNRELDIEVTRRYEAETFYKKVHFGGGVAPTTSVATGSLRAGVAVGSGSIDVFANLVSWRGDTLTELNPDGQTVMETISGRILKGATHALFAKLTNVHASAYGA
jgi:hypothetical protein